ncbi:MBL fold metallo-hydrolase [Methanosarcinales archaeon]|nr:MAG: MBL fold metallo-hydrolase [Methanosarcinales archaeon]
MKILNLTSDSKMYTSNVYLITGTWNAIDDLNTLVDVGRDPSVIEKINNASTGVGKKRVEQVVLTHSHYDHASLLPQIIETFKPEVYAYSSSLEGVDHLLKDGDMLKLGDRIFEIIYTPGHSSDSICLYCEEERVLFAGDSAVVIRSAGGTYEDGFVHALENICRRDIQSIYFGHGDPLLDNCNARVHDSLKIVRQARK